MISFKIRRFYTRSLFALALFALYGIAASPTSAQKRIYIALDDLTDYYWTADEETYRQAFLETTDYYLNLADQTQNNPSPYQSRFNFDGSLWLWTYERNRSTADFNRLIGRIRSGHISMPLNAAVSDYGGTQAEAVIRGMYYPGLIERRYNLRFPIATSMENHTLPYGLGSLWAGAGARWSWKGVCNCGGVVPNPGDREHDIYWWTGPDDSRILMKWNTWFSHDSLGGYAEARRPLEAIDLVTNNFTFQQRYPYPVIGIFGKGHDDLKTLTDEFVNVARARSNSFEQIIVSNQEDFFRDFEANYSQNIPSQGVSFGNDGGLYPPSMAEVSANVKRSTEKLRAAESLATLVSLKNPAFMSGRTAARDQAWMNLGLYYEHAWTADGAVGHDARRDWQRRISNQITSYVDTLHADAAASLGTLIRKNTNATRFYAFNPLGWTRTDYADFPYADTNPVHVVDVTTGLETPSQIVTIDNERRVRILAKDVPSVGYKVFEVRAGAGNGFSQAASVSGGTLENDYYRLNVAGRGAITSLIDKQRGNREMARPVNNRQINDLGAGTGTVEIENAGAVSVTLRATSSSPIAHTSRITLFRDSDRIDIRNDITQNFSDLYTWGFGFNLNAPDVRHEEVGAITRAKLQSQGGHYSNRTQNSRYDWLTLNHFANMSGADGAGVTLSNHDTYFMKLGNSSVSSLDAATPLISVLAGGQVDGSGVGIRNQAGDSRFLQRFALRTRNGYDATAEMRFSLEHQNPFVTGAVTGTSAAYPESSYSLVQINDPNVLLWALKPAEEGIGDGVIARVWNVSDNNINFTLRTPQTIASAKRTTHIETNLEDASVTADGGLAASVGARQLRTFRLRLNNPDANPIDNLDFFIRQQYLDFFGRTPSQSEIDTWKRVIIQPDCPRSQNCFDRIYLAGKGFFFSQEFQQKGYYVYRFYKAGLGRLPTFVEFVPDITGLQGTSDADKNNFANAFVARPQFRQIYDGLSNAAYVDRLMSANGVTSLNRAQLIGDLDANRKTRAQVLRAIVETGEVYSGNFNEAWVVMQYFAYLRRDGAPSEYAAWKAVLDRNPSDYRTMTHGFIYSTEYRARFGRP